MTRPRSDRQIVAAAFRGKLTKPASAMTDAYVHRLAQAVRAARAAGERPTRQVARGHAPRMVAGRTVTTEHPKEYIRREGKRIYGAEIGKATPSPIRGGPDNRHVTGHARLSERDFSTLYPAWRWATSHDPATGVQAIGYGELQPEWVKKTGSGIPPRPDNMPDDDEEPEDDEPEKAWRPFYTGNAAGDADENGQVFATYADAKAARDFVFVPGSVESYLIRRQG